MQILFILSLKPDYCLSNVLQFLFINVNVQILNFSRQVFLLVVYVIFEKNINS